MALALGDIYGQAHRSATPELKDVLDLYCLQDLVHCAVHSNNRFATANVRALLSKVPSLKKEIVEVVLSRALHVANPVVRKNACIFHADYFPIYGNKDVKRDLQLLYEALGDSVAMGGSIMSVSCLRC